MTNVEAKSDHAWDKNEVNQYGDGRCFNCGMKFKYFLEGINSLNTWTKKEIEEDKEGFAKKAIGLKVCGPR